MTYKYKLEGNGQIVATTPAESPNSTSGSDIAVLQALACRATCLLIETEPVRQRFFVDTPALFFCFCDSPHLFTRDPLTPYTEKCRILRKGTEFGSADIALCRIFDIIKKSGSRNREKARFHRRIPPPLKHISKSLPGNRTTQKIRQAMCRI